MLERITAINCSRIERIELKVLLKSELEYFIILAPSLMLFMCLLSGYDKHKHSRSLKLKSVQAEIIVCFWIKYVRLSTNCILSQTQCQGRG